MQRKAAGRRDSVAYPHGWRQVFSGGERQLPVAWCGKRGFLSFCGRSLQAGGTEGVATRPCVGRRGRKRFGKRRHGRMCSRMDRLLVVGSRCQRGRIGWGWKASPICAEPGERPPPSLLGGAHDFSLPTASLPAAPHRACSVEAMIGTEQAQSHAPPSKLGGGDDTLVGTRVSAESLVPLSKLSGDPTSSFAEVMSRSLLSELRIGLCRACIKCIIA